MKTLKGLLLLVVSIVATMGLSTIISAKTLDKVAPAVDSNVMMTVDGSFTQADKYDNYYAGSILPIEIAAPGYIEVVVTYDKEYSSMDAEFYTDATFGTKIQSDYKRLKDDKTVQRYIMNAKAAGTYYFGVSKFVGSNVESVNCTLSAKTFSLETGKTLKAGKNIFVTAGQDVVFKYVASKTGLVTFLMPGDYGYHYTIYNSAKKVLINEGWTSSTYGNSFDFVAKKGSVYYFKIKTIESDMCEYNVSISEKAVKSNAAKSKKKAKFVKKKKKSNCVFVLGEKSTYWIKYNHKKFGTINLTFSGKVTDSLTVTAYCGKKKIGSTTYSGGTHKLKITHSTTYGKANKGVYYIKIEKARATSNGYVTVKVK